MNARKNFVWSAIAFLIVATLFFFITDDLIVYFLSFLPAGVEVVAFTPFEIFATSVGLAVLLTVLVFAPFVLTALFFHYSDAMYRYEKIFLYKLFSIGSLLFLFGFFLTTFVFLRYGLGWFASFNDGYAIPTFWRLSSTVNAVLLLGLFAGFLFEIPLVLYHLIKSKIVAIRLNVENRLLLLLFLLVVLAFITPDGSMLTQLLLTIPIYLLIELSVFFGNKHSEVYR